MGLKHILLGDIQWRLAPSRIIKERDACLAIIDSGGV